MRVAAGAVHEDLVLDGTGTVEAAYSRDGDGWVAHFTVRVAGVADLAVTHCLHAPSLAEARAAVPPAAAFLAGQPVGPPPLG
jgi:hypothetical protein